MATVTVSAAKLQLADVCAVAALNARVVLDFSASSTVSAVAGQAQVATQLANLEMPEKEEEEDQVLGEVETRAVLLLLLKRLMAATESDAVEQHAQFLVELLNQHVEPVIPRDAIDTGALYVLAAAEGRGLVRKEGNLMTVAEAGIPLPAPLSANAQAIVAQGPIVLLASTVLAVGGARGLLPVADAVAALSCEMLHASALPFEAEFVDSSRPHRGIVTSASNLRLMLEASKYVDADKAIDADPICLRHIPQYHGPARDGVLSALKTVEVELESTIGGRAAVDFHPQALQMALATVREALGVLLQGSNERRMLLDATAIPIRAKEGVVAAVKAASEALVAEADATLAFFRAEEEQVTAKLAVKNVKAQEAAARAAAAAAKEDAKLEAMPEDKRLKILEKRRKKLEKQKEKESAKKGGKEELKVGVGSAAVRQLLLSLGEEWRKPTAAFDLHESGLMQSLESLLLRLGSGGTRRKPKIARGTQDFLPFQMQLRERIFNKIRMVFKRHAGVEIETPVFELKETLTGKYGEDSKLIYDLADQGGELLALRYDLTVPFARFMALHNPGNIKRYHIARVYRRDNPQIARGRFREFYQCDFDVAGSFAPMLPDAEVVSIGIEVLQQFPEVGSFSVKLSHRRLLDAIFAICGVPANKFRTICSAIDKLDKESWEVVREEMVEEKGLPAEVADRIEPLVCRRGAPRALHAELMKENAFGDNADAKQAMDELKLLFDYLDAMGVLDYISFDLSLARGLDYYTGVIYEFVLTDPSHGVGSIAAGGRYDNLVGMFSATGAQIPCVGVSLGIERIFGLLQAHAKKQNEDAPAAAQVLVASTGGELLLPRLELCKELWRANIAAETMQLPKPKLTKQLHLALEKGIPFMVVIGEDELSKGTVKIKEMRSREEVEVARDAMVTELLRLQCKTTDTLQM